MTLFTSGLVTATFLAIPAFAAAPASGAPLGAVTTVKKAEPYKEARAACLKENAALKGKELRTCVTAKEKAALGTAPAAATSTPVPAASPRM